MVKKSKEERKSIKIVIDGQEYEAQPKVFSTGRKGYGLYKVLKIETIDENGNRIKYPHRLSLNLMEM